MINVDSNPTTRWAIHFLALVGVVFALRYGRMLMIPVVISLMLTTVLWPVVSYFHQHWRLPKFVAALGVIAGLLGLSSLLILWSALALQEIFLKLPPPASWFMTDPTPTPVDPAPSPETQPEPKPDAKTETPRTKLENEPEGNAETRMVDARPPDPPLRSPTSPYQNIHRRVAEINQGLADELFPPKDPHGSMIFQYLVPALDSRKKEVPNYLAAIGEQILFILFLVLFLLIEGEFLVRRTAEIFGPATGPNSRAAVNALRYMAKQVRAYLVWRTVINLWMAIVLGLIYKYVLGMSYPWMWAILAGVLTYIPYFGPAVAFIPAFLDALFSSGGGIGSAIAVVIIYALIITAEGYIIFPLVIGRNMEMNATTVLLGCLFWWLVWDEVGLFLAMPLLAALKAICYSVPGWAPFANLMGMEPYTAGRRGWVRRALGFLLGRINGSAVTLDGNETNQQASAQPGGSAENEGTDINKADGRDA